MSYENDILKSWFSPLFERTWQPHQTLIASLTAASSFIFPYFLTPTLPDLLSLHLLSDFLMLTQTNWNIEMSLLWSEFFIPSYSICEISKIWLPSKGWKVEFLLLLLLFDNSFFSLIRIIFFFYFARLPFPHGERCFFPGNFLIQYSLMIITYLFKTLLSYLFPDDFSDCYNFFFF